MPQWNADGLSHNGLCQIFNMLGISALRMSMPYHDIRRPHEFIEQHDDTPSIYRDMYPAGQGGYHHHGVLVHDYEQEREQLCGRGFELACELHADNVDACYIDTRAVSGGFTELHADPPHILAAFAQWRRAHQLRRPGDPAIQTRN